MLEHGLTAADVSAVAAVINTAALLYHCRPSTTREYIEMGAKYLAEATDILKKKRDGKDEYIIPAVLRLNNHDQCATLSMEREQLEEAIKTYFGVIMNWEKARQFHDKAHNAKESSVRLSLSLQQRQEREQAIAELNQGPQGGFPGYASNNAGNIHLPPPPVPIYFSPSEYPPLERPHQSNQPEHNSIQPGGSARTGYGEDYMQYNMPTHPYRNRS